VFFFTSANPGCDLPIAHLPPPAHKMNRLYLLGAITLSRVEAYIAATSTLTFPSSAVIGTTNTYTATGDCFSGETATTLGLNNIYYQYYTFSISAGSIAWSTTPIGGD